MLDTTTGGCLVCLSHRYGSGNLLQILSLSIMSNNGAVLFSNRTAFIVKLFNAVLQILLF